MSEAQKERSPEAGVRWHPYADIFPWIEGPAFEELKADIAKNGVLEPIVFLNDAILDGRNRYMAARALGIEYPRVEYEGDDPLGFVISVNLNRRHLTTSQRAMIAAKIANLAVGSNQHVLRVKRDIATGEEISPPLKVAADSLKVDRKTAQFARTVTTSGVPELVSGVDAGKVSVSAAAEVAKLPAEEQTKVVAQGPDAVKAVAKLARESRREKVDDPEWKRQQEEMRAAFSPELRAAQEATEAAKAANSATPEPAEDDDDDDLTRVIAALQEDNAALKAELGKFEDMRLQWERGGFEQIIADKDEEIRVLKSRVSAESREKVANLRSADWWKKKAIELGYSSREVIEING